MKTHSLCLGFCLFLLILSACSSGPAMRNATGFAYEVVVTMPNVDWDSPAGKAIKAELRSEVPGLTQAEPAFKITYANPSQFNGLLTFVRNILIVKIDPTLYTKTSVSYVNNRWARNQVVLTMTAPSDESILQYIEQNPRSIVDFFNKCEANRTIAQLQKSYSVVVMETLKKKFDIELNVPSDFTYYRDTTDFFWASNNANTGRMDIAVYTFPYTDPQTFTEAYLVHMRDSVMKANVPGKFPGSYMTTNQKLVTYNAITVNGEYCGVLRGLWEMENDMMGGPFVSHACLDKKNNRVVVVEGFVYAPETDNRNFIRRINAALYTLRLPGQFEDSVEEPLDIPKEKE